MNLKKVLRIILMLLVVAIFVIASTFLDLEQLFQQTRSWFESLGWAGPLLFVLIYGGLGALAAPTGLIEIIAGALFGLFVGGLAVLGGALLAANAGFVCGRWLAREWVAKRMQGNAKAQQIEAAVAQRGFWITVLIRLSPAVPFNLTSYVLGASQIRWLHFVLATVIGMLPIKLLLVWLGASGDELLAATNPTQWGTQEWALYGGGTLATLLVIVLISWIITRASQQVLQEAEQEKPS